MLRVNNLVKKFARLTAVDSISFEIAKGEIFGFVGANGAGKTTTIKMVTGLLRPTQGEIYLDGIELSSNPREAQRKIGYMPDFFGVYDNLTVNEYMNFYAGLYEIPIRQRTSIIQELLELVNLADRGEFYVDSLSRGMKQRLCLARSLIHNPGLLILDEPASGLDPGARIEMKEILKELKSMGKTVLISSHILPELSEISTSIGIINQGKMVASGPVDEIIKRAALTRKIRIKFLGEASALTKVLEEQPHIGNVFTAFDYVDAEFSGDNKDLTLLLKALITANIPVISFTESGENLETLFLEITRGGNKNVS